MGEPLSPEHWYAALSSPRGIAIAVDNPTEAKQRLYLIRKMLDDPDLEDITIITSPHDPNHLWLIKKSKVPDEPAKLWRNAKASD